MEDFERVALSNQQKAREIVEDLDIVRTWQQIGAEARLVGSLRMGLLCKHLDIDFHVYSSPVKVEESFKVVACLASNPKVRKVEYRNLLDTEEACVEWHLWYEESPERVWQIDMIHIKTGSTYDGYFEHVADRIVAAMTPLQREIILRLKHEMPETEKIPGIEYYRAVIQEGIRDYAAFRSYRNQHPVEGILEWMPGK